MGSFSLEVVPTGPPAGLAVRFWGKAGHLPGFWSEKIGMGNREFGFGHINYTSDTRTQAAVTVGNQICNLGSLVRSQV